MAMEKDKIEKKQLDLKLIWRLFKFSFPYMRLVILGVILMLLASAAYLAVPYLIKTAIDDCIMEEDVKALRQIALILAGLFLVQGIASFLHSYFTQMLGQKVMYDLRNRIFSHIQTLSISYFDKNPVGRIITRITSDVENLNQLFTQGIVAILGDLVIIVGIVTAMFLINTTLALWSLIGLPLLITAAFIFRWRVRKGFDDIRYHLARINAFLQENITGFSTVQLFLREKVNLRLFANINQDHTKAHERTIFCFAVFFPVVEFISAGALAIVIFKGGQAIGAEVFTFGALFAFIRYIEMFFKPVSDLADKFNILQSAVVSSERIFKLLDRKSEVSDNLSAKKIAAPVEKIEFDNVVFGYNPDNPVLKGVSFSVEKGRTLALVGHTGAGKTTVINLLERFYDIQSGSIKINGQEIREVTQKSLRSLMVAVQQDPFIFSAPVQDNIRMGEDRISDNAITKAARLVKANSFIDALPAQYETKLVEKGENLSTGQKQLLSFARAMAYDPEILILDEATANIDTPTEALIQSAIAELTRERTSIIIAHRLSTIQNADKIVVLHKGEKAEEGTHQELLSRKGIYWRLYKLQFNRSPIKGTSTN